MCPGLLQVSILRVNPNPHQCEAGKYSATIGSIDCTLCAPGFYQASSGFDFCLVCPLGTYSSSQGTLNCTQCDSGEYADETGLTVCKRCPSGRFGLVFGSVDAADCIPCGEANSTWIYEQGTHPSCCDWIERLIACVLLTFSWLFVAN